MQEVENIQAMMRELVIVAIAKFNNRVINNDAYDAGVSSAYGWVLTPLYNQAKLSDIPLNYLSLDTIDPEKASFSNEIIYFDKTLPIPSVKKEYRSSILVWLYDNLPFIKERYEDCLVDINKDEFYKGMIDGYWEIFLLMEKYGIRVIENRIEPS